MRVIAELLWVLLLVVTTACPLIAGCAALAESTSEDCCQQGSCSRRPQHDDDCPYKIRDARQAEDKFSLTFEAPLHCHAGVAALVAIELPAAPLTPPAAPLAETDRYLTLRVLRI